MPRLLTLILTIALCAACTTVERAPETTVTLWRAVGYLSPTAANGEELGNYDTAEECQKIVDGWKSRQVVGNPVSGECIAVNVTR